MTVSLQNQIFTAPGIKAVISEHESGSQKIYFSCFNPAPISQTYFKELFDTAKETLGETQNTEVYVDSDQVMTRKVLEEDMGFTVTGIKYGFDAEHVAQIMQHKRQINDLSGYKIRPLNFDADIDALVQLEISIHAADKSSRVSFDTEASIESMKQYYRRIGSNDGAFVLVCQNDLIGIAGFMPSSSDPSAVNISSIGIALPFQGKGLFWPFVCEAFWMSPFTNRLNVTGVTTTSRLIAASEKYGAKLLGHILSKGF